MKYFLNKTDLPFYDNILKNPEYHIRAKGIHHKVVYMTPDQYMKEVAIMQGTTVQDQYDMISPGLVKQYKAQTLAGSPMPMLSLEPPRNQEGRHRAMVAKELGLKKIPVLKVWKE